jgi:hypothetical protein
VGTRLVHGQTPVEYFREQVGRAMEHQRVSTSALTEYYLVNLLASCVRAESLPAPEPGFEETPLALLYIRALRASHYERARLLRGTGDTALFLSGFFAESLSEKAVDIRYYQALGGSAYAHLSREHEQGSGIGPSVFAELADRFNAFADVLAEVSEASRLTSSLSLLRLYERWLRSGSRRAAQLLAEQGITPVDPGEGRVH